jgi:hypothetical protein
MELTPILMHCRDLLSYQGRPCGFGFAIRVPFGTSPTGIIISVIRLNLMH